MKKVEFLYLSQEDIMSLNISWKEIIKCVRRALKEHGEKTVENPPKPGVHSRLNSFIHAMPVHLQQMDAIGIKWVSGYPNNYKHGLPQILGLQIMNSAETGVPLAVMDCRWITAVRTAAVTAITASYCARKDTRKIAIIGAGVQGKTHTLALKHVFSEINECRVYDIKKEVLYDFKEKMSAKTGIDIYAAKSVQDAVEGVDIILTATQRIPKPLIEDAWFKPGMFGAGLEASRAWADEIILGADKFITDDWKQTLHFKEQGAFPGGMPELYAELGEIVAGKKIGRENENEKILAINIGLACEDISIGQFIYEVAMKKGVGTMLPLMEKDF